MADEVYKILQSRLRRNAQHTNCRDQQPDCDVYINTLSEDTNSHARKKTRVAPPGAEVKKKWDKSKTISNKKTDLPFIQIILHFWYFWCFQKECRMIKTRLKRLPV